MHTLGRYELIRPLNGEQDGTIWEAELVGPAGFRKRVAVLRLEGRRSDALHAARSAGLLHHGNLVEVYEIDEVDGTWLCAMELVRGGPLVRRAPLPPRALVEAGIQVCAGLGAALREVGMVHGALSPESVLVDEGVVKVAGLGLKPKAPGAPWSAPEVATGGEPNPRADVWAVGQVLRALAGGPVDPAIDAVIARCLESDPGARFADAEALGAALEALEPDGPGLGEITAGSATPSPAARWGVGGRTNLPEAASLHGRASVVAELAVRLGTARLITVKGAPGIGKSAVARAAARSRLAAGALAEVWAIHAGPSLAGIVARTIGLDTGDGALAAGLVERGAVLLAIDGIEPHLDQAAAIAGWLAQAPGLRVVVASREPLRVPGEQLVELGPLDDTDAIALLVARGVDRAAAPELARRADGVPGALVALAANPALPDDRMLAAHLVDLRAALHQWELDALARLAPFAGPFTLDQAEEALDGLDDPDAPWALDVLADLVDRSLVSPAPSEDAPRFRLLAPIRAWILAATT